MLKRCLLSMFILVMVAVFVVPTNANARSEKRVWTTMLGEDSFQTFVDLMVIPWESCRDVSEFQAFTHNDQVVTVIYYVGTNMKKMWMKKSRSADNNNQTINIVTMALCPYTLADKMLDISYDNLKGRSDPRSRELRDNLEGCDFVLNGNVYPTYEREIIKALSKIWEVSIDRARQLYNEDMQIVFNAAVERLGGIENITIR